MTKRDKLRVTVLSIPAEMRFADIKLVLEDAGWVHVRTVGSHHQFSKEGERTQTIVEHNGVATRAYIRQVARVIEDR